MELHEWKLGRMSSYNPATRYNEFRKEIYISKSDTLRYVSILLNSASTGGYIN